MRRMISTGGACIYYAHARLVGVAPRSERRAQQSRAARQLAVRLLAGWTDSKPADWRIGRARDGRPEVHRHPAGWNDFRISLTHDGALIGCAIARGRDVGIDVQRVRSGDCRRLAECCGWDRLLPELPDPLDGARFTRLWTLWEACLKQLGGGAGSAAARRLDRQFTRLARARGTAPRCAPRHVIESIGSAWLSVVG